MSNINFAEMSNSLTSLFRRLSFPIGGTEKENETIWMAEPNKKLTAINTSNGIVVVSSEGTIYLCSSLEEMEKRFIEYFSGKGSLQNTMETLASLPGDVIS